MKIHEKYIKRCVQLAENGLGRTYPNPMVGSVIVHENNIIGEGWHQKAGKAHAEVNAINSVKDKNLLKKTTLYVSLEPCSHYGKTPPCSDLIIASGIKKVVIGMLDPFPEVSGKGIKKLLDAGCEVIVGVLEQECTELNKRFLSFQLKKRPYIILKWAKSEDGFLSPFPAEKSENNSSERKRKPIWISNQYSKQRVHKWRSEEQAILVGTNTAVTDNPKLNTRLWKGNNPVRIVIDQHLRIPKDSAVFDGSIKTIVIIGKELRWVQSEKSEISNHKNIFLEKIDFKLEIAAQICEVLYKYNLQSVIIEGGGKTLETFIAANLWDEARIFTGVPSFKKGITAPTISGKLISEEKITTDSLKIYSND